MQFVRLSDTIRDMRIGLAMVALLALAPRTFGYYMIVDPTVVVAPDGRHVYQTVRDGIEAHRIVPETGALELIERKEAPGGVKHLGGLAVTRDGRHLYAASWWYGIVVAERDPATGALTFRASPARTEDLVGTIAVSVSPDGRHVYVAGHDSQAVVTFARNGDTGDLTAVAVHRTTSAPSDTRVSRDGSQVLVTSWGNPLVVLERDPSSGSLHAVANVAPADGDVSIIDVDGSGASSLRGIAPSPDGEYVYVAATALVISRRDESGRFTFVQSLPWGGSGERPKSVAVTPDGRRVYATPKLAGFSRDAATGRLSPID